MRLQRPEVEDKETARIEAFSDGVYAIAVTLLVLDIHVPDIAETARSGGLLHALTHQWPTYLAYVTSFLTILIMWINHHRLFQLIRKRDHNLFMLNGLLLMATTLVPFPTALVAKYLLTPEAKTATVVFAGSYLVIAIFYNLLWRHISDHLLRHDHDASWTRAINRQYNIGLTAYVAAFLIAFVSPMASVVGNLLLAVFFALPERVVAWATGTMSEQGTEQ
jgi:uncharacterized membrane protein